MEPRTKRFHMLMAPSDRHFLNHIATVMTERESLHGLPVSIAEVMRRGLYAYAEKEGIAKPSE